MKTGFNIHSIVNKYEEDSIKPKQMFELLNIEGFKEQFKRDLEGGGYDESKIRLLNAFLNDDPEDEDMFEDDFEFHPTPRFIAELWIFLLNKIDSELNLKMIFKEKLPSLHYYVFDEKGRHLDQVGYGLFD